MIIDYNQKKDGVEISYVNEKKQIVVDVLPLKQGYYKYVAANSFDKDILPDLRSFKENSHIKRESAKYFQNHNINEFFAHDLKKDYSDIYEKISQLSIPNPFSIDIETEITDKYGYSTPERAENRILSISITDINLNSILFIIKNPDKPELQESDKLEINGVIMNALGPNFRDKYDYNWEVRIFDTEYEMLDVFAQCVNKYFHCLIGWNISLFDWVWIQNRMQKNNIDMRKASPTFKQTKTTFTLKDKSQVTVITPTHRSVIDYMQLFKEALIYNNMESYSLDFISEHILGLKKVMYEGNLRTLYNNEYNKFIGYAFIDTILVMLNHKATNLYNVDFFESYFNGIPYARISQNAISEALVYNELITTKQFLLHSEFNTPVKRKYKGGYVKDPTKKIIEAGAGLDFSGLYPNSMITIGISPDTKVDSILVNEFGRPLNEVENRKWLAYREQNFTLSPMGRIYDKNKDGVFIRVEKKLIAQRKIFKGHAEDIYLNVAPKLEKLLAKKEAEAKAAIAA
jgi:DNA polymerase elongation subunit (family B)